MTERQRDELIASVGCGHITPDQAEAEAAAKGWEPFAREPALPKFDPMQEPRWLLVMAIAWIAWRDLSLVRKVSPTFRADCIRWVRCDASSESGSVPSSRPGWLLETWPKMTSVRLSQMEHSLASRSELPPTTQMSVREAAESLWRALSEDKLTAEALNKERQPVDIGSREWSYLKLFEERGRDVLKYDALDKLPKFTEVKLQRAALLKQCPERETWPIESYMLKPIAEPGNAGFVPLCAALQWIMTDGGTRPVMMDDASAWAAAVASLWPLICTGEMELIGLGLDGVETESIKPQSLTVIEVRPPLDPDMTVLNGPSFVTCTPYIDQEDWRKGGNDKLYKKGIGGAAWTHLQVRKADVLARWPPPERSPEASNSTAPAVSVPPTTLPEDERLMFAVDLERGRVLFAGGPIFVGKDFDLINELTKQFEADQSLTKTPDEFLFLRTQILLERLHCEENPLIQRFYRIRRKLKSKHEDREIIQSAKWQGYRLNPNLLLVDSAQLRALQGK